MTTSYDSIDRLAYESLLEDSLLGTVVEENGIISIQPAQDSFNRIVRSIVGQQISTSAADSIFDELESSVRISASEISKTPIEVLKENGLSQSKASAVRELSMTWEENGWSRDFFMTLDNDEIHELLTGVTGIGPWTADMALIFCFGRQDVFPVTDLGIRNAMNALLDDSVERDEMLVVAEHWQPYRSYAALYLWKYIH